MVTKIFSKFLSWHRENSKYYHYHFVIGYAVFLPFMLFVFIMSGNTGFDSWIIFALNVCIGLNYWKDWRIERWQHEYDQFVKECFANTVDMLEINSRNIRRLEDRLISVNRRRKRSERNLKQMTKRYYHERLLREREMREMVVTPEQRDALANALRGVGNGIGKFKPGMLTYKDPVPDEPK